MIIYLIKVQVLLLVAAALYMLFFSKETNFRFKRYFILSAVMLSLVLPLMKVPTLLSKEISYGIAEQMPVILLPAVVVGDAPVTEIPITPKPTMNWMSLIGYAYLLVVIMLGIKLILQLINIVYFIFKHRSSLEKSGPYYIAEIDGKIPTFSFFNFLFLNKQHWKTEKERDQILIHEIEHVKQWNTLDVLLLEIVCIICWFNPVVYFFKAQAKAIHEYLADARVLNQTNDSDYAKLLVRSALSTLQLGLVNQFHNSLTLKRLSMMKAVKRNISKWKLGMLLPGIALAVFIIACQDQIIAEMEEISKTTTIIGEFPLEFTEQVNKIKAENPDIKLNYLESEFENHEKIRMVNPDNILYMRVLEKDGIKRIGMIVKYDENMYTITELTKNEDNIFLVVEETASPVGGMDFFYNYLMVNIKYPDEARRLGIEGRVFIEFVVNTDGSVSDVRAIKGIGAGCDEEAVRLVSKSPPWNPGKQRGVAIRQRLVLPIIFRLGNSNGNTTRSDTQTLSEAHLPTVNVISYGQDNRVENQSAQIPKKEGDLYYVTEQPPTPQGGMTAFYDYVQSNMRYPSEARMKKIEGKVFVQFVVNIDGSISNVLALRGIGAGCDEEAIRIVSQSPSWNPGKQGGKAVKHNMVLPIIFELNK